MKPCINIACRIPNEAVEFKYTGKTERVLKQLYDDLSPYRDQSDIKHFHNELENYIACGQYLNIAFMHPHPKSKADVTLTDKPADELIQDLQALMPAHAIPLKFNVLNTQAQ